MTASIFVTDEAFRMTAPPRIGLYYDAGAYREQLRVAAAARAGAPQGLMGRQVAGKEFLDAYLHFGRWDQLLAVTPNDASAQSLLETCRSHPASRSRQRRLSHITTQQFHKNFLAQPPVPVVHFPTPPDPKFAWARRVGSPHGFALCGVTHTLCSLRAIEVLRGLVTDPWEPYDRLICTSRAVTAMVGQVMESFGDYLQERHQLPQRPVSRIGLETIPLGVDAEKFRPPTLEERTRERQRLGIADDEMMILYVGRLSHHAKAHPFPMFRGLSEAALETNTKVRLCLMGWAGNDAVRTAFQSAAREFGPHLKMEIVDGLNQENRFRAWWAADGFCSLSDNIQETFGLVIIEAMACGLPVVATDWNGYRDLVIDGETGFLVPTVMIPGASGDLTSRLLTGELDYNRFLAQSSQSAIVETPAVTAAFARLFRDADLRNCLGAAGRKRVSEEFAWSKIIPRYEDLWAEQTQMLETYSQAHSQERLRHEIYPPPEVTFAGYPSGWLQEETLLISNPVWRVLLDQAMNHPLTHYAPDDGLVNRAVKEAVLSQAKTPCPLSQLAAIIEQAGVNQQTARRAWRG